MQTLKQKVNALPAVRRKRIESRAAALLKEGAVVNVVNALGDLAAGTSARFVSSDVSR